MAISSIENIRIAGIVSCVPSNKVDNLESDIFESRDEAKKFIKATGVRFKRVVENTVCTSDLCEKAALDLLKGVDWKKEEISVIIMVTQTPDYLAPNTAIIMQDRLGLPKSCLAFDIPLGCSGYVYGITIISSILKATGFKKGLLLVGDTLSRQASPFDKSAYPLFGDAGTATAIEITEDKNQKIDFLLSSDGEGYQAIIIPGGGYREPINSESLNYSEYEGGIRRNRCNTVMNGSDVFSFGISVVPNEISKFLNYFKYNINDFDYVIFHQANLFMNEKIRKKIGFSEDQVPYSLNEYGNTSSATIPVTINHALGNSKLNLKNSTLLLCGFGVGLSWGICKVNINNIYLPEIVEYN